MSRHPSLLTRRQVGLGAALGAVILGLVRFGSSSSSEAGSPETSLPPGRLLLGPFQALSPYQATLLDEVTALLIPTDQDPGAREAKVLAALDGVLSTDEARRGLYHRGLAWLDLLAEGLYGQGSFLTVPAEGRLRILELAESGALGRVQTLKEWWRFGRTGHGREFFHAVKADTFAVFYTSRAGWQVAGYQGPPQFGGYPGHAQCG